MLCYKKLSKFEQYFELVSRIVKLKILTRKTTDKKQHGSSANFSIIYLNKTIQLPW
jgi:hypothetical protein